MNERGVCGGGVVALSYRRRQARSISRRDLSSQIFIIINHQSSIIIFNFLISPHKNTSSGGTVRVSVVSTYMINKYV
jgi:hypothetical protein